MVKVRRKPLFNRRYLQILALVLPFVILALNLSGQRARVYDKLQRLDADGVYFLPGDSDHYTLHLLLPAREALSDAGWLATQLQRASLSARLRSPEVRHWLDARRWQGSLESHGGYLQLSFTAPQPPDTQQRHELLALLQQPAAIDTQALRTRLHAQRYLDNQQPQQRLLSAFGAQLERALAASPAAAPRWTLTGPALTAAPAAPAATATAASAAPAWQAGSRQLTAWSGDPSWQLLGQPLSAPASAAALARQRLGAELIHQLLSTHTPDSASFRWLWQPLTAGGYRALLLRGWPDSAPIQELVAQLSPALLNATRRALLDQFDTLSKEDPQQWLDLLALYRLPPDSHEAFIDTLKQIDLQQARALVSSTLQPQHSLHLSFTNPGTPSS